MGEPDTQESVENPAGRRPPAVAAPIAPGWMIVQMRAGIAALTQLLPLRPGACR